MAKVKEIFNLDKAAFAAEFSKLWFETCERISMFKDAWPSPGTVLKIAQIFAAKRPDLDWDEVKARWENSILNNPPENKTFNENVFYSWMRELSMLRDTMNREESKPPPDWPTTEAGVLDRMLPTLKAGLTAGAYQELSFVGPLFLQLLPEIVRRLSQERATEIQNEITGEWFVIIKQLFDREIKEGETLENFQDRIQKIADRTRAKVPDLELMIRKSLVSELLEKQNQIA